MSNQLFEETYRVSTTRVQQYDYAQNGAYFITICSKDRQLFFGTITDSKVQLSKIGQLVSQEWMKTSELRQPNIVLGPWIIMPNHFHGILVIQHEDSHLRSETVLKKRNDSYHGLNSQMSQISPVSDSVSTVIRFFKRQTTLRARNINKHFSWQPRFYEHIIRSEQEFDSISEYIMNNPLNWEKDTEYMKCT